jgi:hypothetical protein
LRATRSARVDLCYIEHVRSGCVAQR